MILKTLYILSFIILIAYAMNFAIKQWDKEECLKQHYLHAQGYPVTDCKVKP